MSFDLIKIMTNFILKLVISSWTFSIEYTLFNKLARCITILLIFPFIFLLLIFVFSRIAFSVMLFKSGANFLMKSRWYMQKGVPIQQSRSSSKSKSIWSVLSKYSSNLLYPPSDPNRFRHSIFQDHYYHQLVLFGLIHQ